jgi:hypothetical protein
LFPTGTPSSPARFLTSLCCRRSTREGFGLTVTEAMRKDVAVIGGDVGSIRHQIAERFGDCLKFSANC